MYELIIPLVFIYLVLAYMSHYESMMFGSVLPEWLCVFCIFDRGKEYEKRQV